MSVIRADRVGRKIFARGWVDPETTAKFKMITGGQFSRQGGPHWEYPLDMTVCIALREAFGSGLKIDDDLWAWAKAENDRLDRLNRVHHIRSAEPLPLPRVERYAPTMYRAMLNRGYQTHIPWFAQEVGSYFNASEPGTGKTIETIATLVERGVTGRLLIAAPSKALRATWQSEIARWLFDCEIPWTVTAADAIEGSTVERELVMQNFVDTASSESMNFLLTNPEAVRIDRVCPAGTCRGNDFACRSKADHERVPLHPALFDQGWDAIVFDETHKYLMNGNPRARNVSQVALGMQKLPLEKRNSQAIKIGMSGTPFKGKPRRFWPVLRWLRPDKYPAQGRWEQSYFQTITDPWSHSGEKITDELRPEREEAFARDLSMIMVRHTKTELRQINPAWAPPDKRHVIVRLPMDPKQRRAYHAMRDDAAVRLDGGVLMASGILAERTRLKQFASTTGRLDRDGTFHPALPSNKWDWIRNVFLSERGILDKDGTSKVVIASQFTQILDAYKEQLEKLKIPYEWITGSQTESIQKIQRRWQGSGEARVCLISTMAGGVSLTLDAADDLVINDETDNPDDQIQVEDRVHRTGRTDHQVTVYRLVSEDTVDEEIAGQNWTMDKIQKWLMDGRRGVHDARSLFGGQ